MVSMVQPNKNGGPVQQDQAAEHVEREKGIEPSSVAWEATALPLSYTRMVESLMPLPPHRELHGQKVPPTVANTLVLLPPFWPTVRLVPRLVSKPIMRVRAPTVTVP